MRTYSPPKAIIQIASVIEAVSSNPPATASAVNIVTKGLDIRSPPFISCTKPPKSSQMLFAVKGTAQTEIPQAAEICFKLPP